MREEPRKPPDALALALLAHASARFYLLGEVALELHEYIFI